MHKPFATYGTILVMLFAAAMHEGYVVNSLFSGARHAAAGANRYHK